MPHAVQGGAPAGRGLSAHHTPDFCMICGGKLVRHRSRHLPEPYWWCRGCRSATVCACEGCEIMRALAR